MSKIITIEIITELLQLPLFNWSVHFHQLICNCDSNPKYLYIIFYCL